MQFRVGDVIFVERMEEMTYSKNCPFVAEIVSDKFINFFILNNNLLVVKPKRMISTMYDDVYRHASKLHKILYGYE